MSTGTTWLYPGLLRDAWTRLPAPVRSAHFAGTPVRLSGRLEVEVGNSRLARLLLRVLRLPAHSGPAAATLTITGGPDREMWSREIGESRLSSVQTAEQGMLRERTGLWEFEFRLTPVSESLWYTLERVRMRLWGLTLPVPGWAAPRVAATESAAPAPFCTEIDVRLSAPGIGFLVNYRGSLKREDWPA